MSQKNFYITTTLPYINSDPHIGFALEIVQADVIARFKASQGCDVFFNTGTDEHGAKIYESACQAELTPQLYSDRQAERFRRLKEKLNLSYNNFIRTTDKQHLKAAQEFWRLSSQNGDVYKKTYKSRYCVGCELAKTDSELINGRCALHPNRELELIEEENYFFRFSKYQQRLLDLYQKNPDFVIPHGRHKEITQFVKNGLKDFSISRLKEKLPWGVPVPDDEDHVMYVWFDALVNYISALGWPQDKKRFGAFWPGMQVAGKDNLRQQAAMWQAMLMSAGLPNSTQILIHGFITSEGTKMSKSLGNVVNPIELIEKYGTDAVRYYLLREIPPTDDGDFSIDSFEQRYTSDLQKGLGNLVERVTGLAQKQKARPAKIQRLGELKKLTDATGKQVFLCLEEFRFNEALRVIWELARECDRLLEREQPWRRNHRLQESSLVIEALLATLQKIADFLTPLLPATATSIQTKISGQQQGPLFPRLR